MSGSKLPTSQLVESFNTTDDSSLSVVDVDPSEVSKYGIVSLTQDFGRGGSRQVRGIVAKPDVGAAPSNLASLGRYVFSPDIWGILHRTAPGKGGEIQLAVAIDELARQGSVDAIPVVAPLYDCGSKMGYLEAILDTALSDDRVGATFKRLVETRVQQHLAA